VTLAPRGERCGDQSNIIARLGVGNDYETTARGLADDEETRLGGGRVLGIWYGD
jgi:hypothetical protein